MSVNDTATTAPAPAPAGRPSNGAGARSGVSVGAVFARAYRLLHSKLLAVLILLAMAILALIGTLVQQAPVSKAADPQAYAQWLETVTPRYGGWTRVFDFAGFFHMWSSLPFLAVSVLLALSIIACTTHRLPLLIKRTLHPRTHVSDRFFANAQYRAQIPLDMPAEEALARLRSSLTSRHFRLVPDAENPGARLYADRFRFGPFGTVIAHAAFVIILAAFVVSAFTGFERPLDLAIGRPTAVGHGTDLTVTATSFKDSYDEQGRPLDYVTHLVAERGGQVVAEQDVRVNTPLVVDGVRFHQANFGLAAVVSVSSGGQELAASEPVALKWTSQDGANSVGRLDLPEQDLEIIVATPASGQPGSPVSAGSAIVEVYRASDGTRLDVAPVDQGKEVSVADLTVTFEREAQFTGITARQDPGAWVMWVGSALLVIGMVMTFALRHRRLWAWVEERGSSAVIHLAAVEEPDTLFDRHFRELTEEIARRDAGAAKEN